MRLLIAALIGFLLVGFLWSFRVKKVETEGFIGWDLPELQTSEYEYPNSLGEEYIDAVCGSYHIDPNDSWTITCPACEGGARLERFVSGDWAMYRFWGHDPIKIACVFCALCGYPLGTDWDIREVVYAIAIEGSGDFVFENNIFIHDPKLDNVLIKDIIIEEGAGSVVLEDCTFATEPNMKWWF